MTYVIISLARRRVCFYQRLIASLLSRYFNVRMVSSRLYDPAADQIMVEVFNRFGIDACCGGAADARPSGPARLPGRPHGADRRHRVLPPVRH